MILRLRNIILICMSVILYRCADPEAPHAQPNIDQQLADKGLTRTVLGQQLENPYSIENMQLAFDTLISAVRESSGARLAEDDFPGVELAPTDLYVKILPSDTAEIDRLIEDSTLILYDYPLDYEVLEAGDLYVDPTVGLSGIYPFYTVVGIDHRFADSLKYEVLAELFIPENAPTFEVEDDSLLSNGRVAERQTFDLGHIERVSLFLTGNMSEEEFSKENNSSNARRQCVRIGPFRYCWGVDNAYYPRGRITVDDSELGIIPVPGVEVTARNWFQSSSTNADNQGNYRVPKEFTRPVKYTITFKRHHFSIREHGLTRQANIKVDADTKGRWNYTIPVFSTDWFNATLYMAAYHYYYQDIQGLRRPPLNSVLRPQMKIAARDKTNDDKNGNHGPFRRFLGIGSQIKVWHNNRNSDEIYATTIHELAHASHWFMGKKDFKKSEEKVQESWCRGVEWVLTRMRYPDHTGRTYNITRPEYTLILADMIDNSFTDNDNEGFKIRQGDLVEGYTIRNIEDALKGQRTWQAWENNIRNKFNNSTEDNLDELFDLY